MKKLLFTLAALLSAGLFASAQVPEFAFSESEITLTPGGDIYTVKINFSKDAGAEVQGGQLQWIMYNAAHEQIGTGVTIQPKNMGTPRQPDYRCFQPGNVVTDMNISVSETLKDEGSAYRALFVSMAGTTIFMGDEMEYYGGLGEEATLFIIDLKADADWADEYATLELVGSEGFENTWVNPAQETFLSTQEMVLKIKNANWTPAEDLDLTGEIVFGELDEATGNIPVSYDGPEEVVLTATINGEAVEIVDGMITLPAYGEYEVYVYANAEGYKEESRMKIFTWTEPVQPEVTEAPVINVTEGEDAYIIEAVGNGEVILYCDGLEVPNPMTIARGDQDATFVFTATAQEEGKEISETTTLEVTVPAKVVVEPEVTDAPVINFNEETLTLTVEGEGEIHVYVNGEEVEVPYTFEPGDEEVTYIVTATAQEEGKEISETVTLEVTVPAKEVKVYEIPMPVVTVDEGADAYTIAAVAGEGTIDGVVITLHVTVYDSETGESTTTEYTDPAVVVIERTDADQYVSYYATASLEEAPEGYDDWTNNLTVAEQIVVPAKGGVEPEDPHMTGYWIVLTDLAGEEHWYSMNADPNGDPNWSIMMTLHHQPWDLNVPFYFMVNGTRYGAETDMQLPEMGDSEHTILNPVFAGENNWYVPAGYTYTWGLQFKDGQIWLLVAQGPMTGIDELIDGKEVAGVRYFNMAGQEMQEANGICIAITTYTDGTTSTVKVIK